ncbi:hypothetical protein DFH09DRAFT_1088485 [Mycena vulgaris]|nr:hypothetical protein DFH09DRAFT_1088485 [Mycena vulgaris]
MATEVGAGSKHTPADRKYLDSLSARLLMEFRNYVGMGVLCEFLQQPAQKSAPNASTTRQFISDLVRVKIEAMPFLAPVRGPPIPVKAELQVACALDEGGREVLNAFGFGTPGSNLKVMEVLQRPSWSSSAITLPEPDACSASSDVMHG